MTIELIVILALLIFLRLYYFRGISNYSALPGISVILLIAVIFQDFQWYLIAFLLILGFFLQLRVDKVKFGKSTIELEKDSIQRGLVSTEAAILLNLPIEKVIDSQIKRLEGFGVLSVKDLTFRLNEFEFLKDGAQINLQVFHQNGLAIREIDLLLIQHLIENDYHSEGYSSQTWLRAAFKPIVAKMLNGFDRDMTEQYYRGMLAQVKALSQNKTSQEYYDPGWKALTV